MGDCVSHRNIKLKDQPKEDKSTTKFKRNFHGVEGVFSFSDQIDILGRVGYANHTLFERSTGLKVKTKYALAYGVGIRAAVHEMDNVVPYVGVQYTKNRMNLNLDPPVVASLASATLGNPIKFKNRKNIGVIAGVGMLYNEKASLNLEGRFLVETAFGVSAQFRF